MNTITISKNLIKNDDLVIIPRKKYEELLNALNKRVFYSRLNKDLNEAMEEFKKGKCYGLFNNVKDLMKSLKS